MTSISLNPALNGVVRAQAQAAVNSQVTLRPDAAELLGENGSVSDSARVADVVARTAETETAADAGNTSGDQSNASETSSVDGLSEQERRQVEELQARDREVRAHEQAHLAAAGPYAKGGIQYTFQRGPDGRLYAVGGQVSVDTSEVPDDPEATLRKAQTLRRAALAPAEPSRQDRAVAAQMSRMAAEASQEIAAESREAVAAAIESQSDTDDSASADRPPTKAREAIAAYSIAQDDQNRIQISV